MPLTKFRTCNLCEALCGIVVEVEGNKVLSIKGDKDDVFSKGHICPKAVALKDLHEDPDRLKFPLEKVNDSWKQISWEEAFQKATEGLHRVQQKYGQSSLAVYQGNPSVHNLGTGLFAPNLVRAFNTKNRFSATSVDQLAHHLAGEYMLGHQFLVPVPDIDRTDFWLILGGNPLVSNGSLMTAPNVSGKLRAIQKRGGKVVVVDPRRTETAKKADMHFFIRPTTDVFLILGMINEVFRIDALNLRHLESYVNREEIMKIKVAVQEYTLERVEEITGVHAENIRKLTREFVNADSAVCYGRLGVSATTHGGLCHWAINTLNILTGNFDHPGGAMLTSPVIDLSKVRSGKKRFRRWKSRVRGLPEFGGELPSSVLAEEILEPGEGQVKGLFTSCGNPVLSVPNGRYLDQALESLEFMVSVDIYVNETTRHANIILPPATGLETPHFGIAFHNLAVRNTAKFSEPSVEKEPGTKYDWEIYSGLQKAYEKLNKSDEDLSPQFSLDQLLSMALQMGGSGLTLEELKKHPHGIDLGALKSVVPDRIKNPGQEIDIFPGIYKDALKKLDARIDDYNGLMLIGRRHLRSNNSWLHNSYRMVKGPERCTLLIHPKDAATRGISDGDEVIVASEVGRETIKAEVSDEMMVGTVSIPHGWGHNRKGIKMSIASDHAGVSINDLIDHKSVDQLSGVSVISGIPVKVFAKVETAVS